MSLPANGTKLQNLINPEVLGDYIDDKLIDAVKFAPICGIDNTLVGQPGDTLTVPKYEYIGDAVDVAEGEDIPIRQLNATSIPVTVKKAGAGAQITDESMLSAFGNPAAEVGDQFVLSLASKLETDIIASLETIMPNMTDNTHAAEQISSDTIIDATVLFGEDADEPKILFISPKQRATLMKNEEWVTITEMGVERLLAGVIGMINGCQVQMTNRIKPLGGVYHNFIVKPNAVHILMKRGSMVESDRDIINKSTVYTTDKHYTTYLRYADRAVKMIVAE